jgi:hypothetical protein
MCPATCRRRDLHGAAQLIQGTLPRARTSSAAYESDSSAIIDDRYIRVLGMHPAD